MASCVLAILRVPRRAAGLDRRRLRRAARPTSALREQVAAQEQDVAALEAERERWQDPAYVEQQARERLKFVKPGERSYTVLDAEPSRDDEGPGARASPTGDEPAAVVRTVWESTRTADAPGARR